MTPRLHGLALLLLVLGAACDGGGDSDPDASTTDAPAPDAAAVDARDGFWVTGTVRAESGTIPVDGKLLTVWSVTDDEPRTGLHKRGEILRAGPTFDAPFAPPPDEATYLPGLAVALLVHVAADKTVPEGDIQYEQLLPYQGLSLRHAVIHRTGEVAELPWASAFPLGFSCGRCVQNPEEPGWDHYEPAPCDELEVVTGLPDEPQHCNWN